MVAPASQMYQSWSPEQGLAGLADLSSRPSSPLLSGALSPTPPRSDPWEWQNPEAQEVFKNQSPENLAASKRPGFLGFGSAGNAIFEDTGEFKDSLRSRGIGPQGSMVGVPPGGVGATVMSYYRRKKPDGTYEYHQTGNTAEPVPSGEGWERSSQEFPGQHGDIDPEWRKEWEKKYGKPDISRPDVPTLNPSMPPGGGISDHMAVTPRPSMADYGLTSPGGGIISDHMVRPSMSDHMIRPPVALPYSGGVMPRPGGVTPRPSMPGFMPRPGGGLIPPPDIQPLLPPELLPYKPPEDGRPRPTPVNPILPGLYQPPTGQQASNLTYSRGPAIRPPSVRLKHGGSLTNRVSDLLQILS